MFVSRGFVLFFGILCGVRTREHAMTKVGSDLRCLRVDDSWRTGR